MIKRGVKKMQEQIRSWGEEIKRIAEKSIQRSKEILKNLGEENMGAEEKDDKQDSD